MPIIHDRPYPYGDIPINFTKLEHGTPPIMVPLKVITEEGSFCEAFMDMDMVVRFRWSETPVEIVAWRILKNVTLTHPYDRVGLRSRNHEPVTHELLPF